ncbi:hypothetical protein D4740_09935 [Actinomyces sp. 2119]|nr:hypothetical protein D4740_09935 [Actinomyces sp. 2119]
MVAGADIHIVAGDLEALAASLDGVRGRIAALDVSAPLEPVGAAMPGSLSSGRAGSAVSRLESQGRVLGGRYGAVGEGTRALVSAHQANDESVAQGAESVGASAASVGQWARSRGLM